MGIFIRLLICILAVGLTLYKYIDKWNELTEVRLSIPILAREVKDIQETNIELQYTIEKFESPAHLMELAERPEFGHLKYPELSNVIFLPENPFEK